VTRGGIVTQLAEQERGTLANVGPDFDVALEAVKAIFLMLRGKERDSAASKFRLEVEEYATALRLWAGDLLPEEMQKPLVDKILALHVRVSAAVEHDDA
jgi:hypothetical protein